MTAPTRQPSAKFALVAVVVIVLAGSFAFYWFFLRGDAPERAALPDRSGETTTTAAEDTGDEGDQGDEGDAPSGTDGTWVVADEGEIFVGYRIEELFAGDTIKKTAVGRTPEVTGTLVVEGTRIVEVVIEADMTALSSDSSRRDDVLRTSGLETDRFTTARFELTEPIDLGALPAPEETVEVVAVGDLTLHGVTRTVEVPLAARWTGEVLDVAGGAPVVLADFEIEAIANAFVAIDDNGEFELQLVFTRG